MTVNFVLLTTGGGNPYAKRIASSIKWINNRHYKEHLFETHIIPVSDISKLKKFSPEDTIIHARAAHPTATWMMSLVELEKKSGFIVVNSTEVLRLTSNKLKCSMMLKDEFPHPQTWEINSSSSMENIRTLCSTILLYMGSGYIVLKPMTSIEQGAHVQRLPVATTSVDDFVSAVKNMKGGTVVVQEFVPHVALYRVIVLNGKALPYAFVDEQSPKKKDWKLSVCLNRETMKFIPEASPNLRKLAEDVQKYISAKVSFIDIFQNEEGYYTLSEINTACNLRIHELLAKKAGHSQWNIHYRIARLLTKEVL